MTLLADCEALGAILVRRGSIDADQLERALAEQKESGRPLGAVLVERGYAAETAVAQALAEQLGLEYCEPAAMEIPSAALAALTPRLAERFKVVPLRLEEGRLTVAVSDPFDLERLDLLRDLTGLALRPALATGQAIEDALRRYYRGGGETVAAVLEGLDETDLLILQNEEGISDLAALESIANEAPIIRLVNLLLVNAVKAEASDVHLEPFEDEVKVRYRIDGILYEVDAPPKRLYPAVLSRIKLMAGMDITEKRLPQDGRIRLRMAERDLDLRVAVAPTLHGESVVLRILNRQNMLFSLETLGFSPHTLAQFTKLIERPHGMILVTGPTGSGKTTTLYAVLAKLNITGRKIITIEDPVEYELKGVNQMQVNPKINFGFAQGMRTIVRHDPDVILVGEIRDRETAEVAIQSALTGHLVFSTLHTNDAAGAFTRLLDMGIEEYLVASTIRGVLAQRLVRRICPACRTSRSITAEELERLGAEIPPGQTVHWGAGCPRCNRIGYRGQVGLYELLLTSPEIESMVMARTSSSRLREQAVKEGLVTLRQDGVAKVREGVTSVGEVLRVTQE
ncbi:MAG: type II secretion system ATPase GspE [Patescibacteria group bacterium]